MSRQPILIVGASGRAAAASALRAGFDPFVLDLFADADTERLCPVIKLPMVEYPHGFVELAKRVPPMPWMYTGGLENYPDVVTAISENRELWGNGLGVLQRVRDPIKLATVLDGLTPRARIPQSNQRESGRWLFKPLRGSAGHGIRFATDEDWTRSSEVSRHYLQEYISGPAMSAIFRGYSEGSLALLGMTRQLIGTTWLHARPFAYAGNISGSIQTGPDPWTIAEQIRSLAMPIGLWGYDFIAHEGRAVMLEVNPRYTASVEVLEFASKRPGLSDDLFPVPERSIGKGIYYAPHRITFPATGPWDDYLAHCSEVWQRPDFADIPHAGDVIEVGHPVLTIFAEANDETECEAKLKAHAAELDSLFAVR